MRKILFDRQSECLRPLLHLIAKQKHRTIVLWALEYAKELAVKFHAKYPHEQRIDEAITASWAWARGEIKMPVARKAILSAHRAAKDIQSDIVYCAIARAIAQAVSSVHVETHAIGGPIYGLTALVYEVGPENANDAVLMACDHLYRRLLYWQDNEPLIQTPWADFLLRDNVPNKEALRMEKHGQ